MNNKTGRRGETNLVAFGGKYGGQQFKGNPAVGAGRSQIAKIRLVCVALARKVRKNLLYGVSRSSSSTSSTLSTCRVSSDSLNLLLLLWSFFLHPSTLFTFHSRQSYVPSTHTFLLLLSIPSDLCVCIAQPTF
jgi:hypothetical protein